MAMPEFLCTVDIIPIHIIVNEAIPWEKSDEIGKMYMPCDYKSACNYMKNNAEYVKLNSNFNNWNIEHVLSRNPS